MAKQRTEEEKEAILVHCLELEETGGDILGYLWSENYLTPRATWCNFQREWLHRKPYEFTDGKPKKKGEKKMNGMDGKARAARQKRLDELKKRIGDGVGIRAALADMGFKSRSAGQMYRQIRNFAWENDPDFFAILPEKISDDDTPVRTDTPTLKVDGPLKIETPEGNQVTVAEVPEKPKITVPLMHSGKKAIGWEGDFGNYIYDRKHQYIDYESNDGEEISMPVESWREWLKEIREIAQLMGVEL